MARGDGSRGSDEAGAAILLGGLRPSGDHRRSKKSHRIYDIDQELVMRRLFDTKRLLPESYCYSRHHRILLTQKVTHRQDRMLGS